MSNVVRWKRGKGAGDNQLGQAVPVGDIITPQYLIGHVRPA